MLPNFSSYYTGCVSQSRSKSNDGSYSPPTAYDISGAAHWHNQADAVLTVHRDFDENTTSVITRKIREQGLYGKIGQAKFKYNIDTHGFAKHTDYDESWEDYIERFSD